MARRYGGLGLAAVARRYGPLGLAVVAVVAVAGCGGAHRAAPEPAPSATPAPPTDRELIGRLLERRATALAGGEALASASGDTPRRRVTDLGLEHPRYGIERVRVRGRRARVRARLSYGIRGVNGTFGSDRVFAARRRAGRWRLDRALGARDEEPWEVDHYARVRSRHFVVFTPSDLTAPIDALEAGYARLKAALTARLRRRYLVVVARDGAHARRLTQSISGLESLTAITDTQIRVRGRALRVVAVGSQRLVIVLPAFLAAPDQTEVIAHELTHAALAPVTSGRVPAWIVEGVALYVSGDDRRAEYAALPTVPTLAGLSEPDAIARLSGDAQRAAYATSSTAAFTLSERYGRDALVKLLLAYNRRSLRGRRGDPELTDRALRRTFGTSLAALQRTLG